MKKFLSIFLIFFTMLTIIVIKREIFINNPWITIIIVSIVITVLVSGILSLFSKLNTLELEIDKLTDKINNK